MSGELPDPVLASAFLEVVRKWKVEQERLKASGQPKAESQVEKQKPGLVQVQM